MLTHDERRARRQKMAQYAHKHTCEDAALRFGVHEATVKAALREHNLPCRKRRPPAVSSFVVLRRLLDGATGGTIAEELNITRQRVNIIKQRAKSAGFTFKK